MIALTHFFAPSIIVNADTISYYGQVFRIMQAAKRAGAKVVAVVK